MHHPATIDNEGLARHKITVSAGQKDGAAHQVGGELRPLKGTFDSELLTSFQSDQVRWILAESRAWRDTIDIDIMITALESNGFG